MEKKEEKKTLKDIFEGFDDDRLPMFNAILRTEAIKWPKEGTYMGEPMSSETRAWIKHFFNIEESEL